jgi:hypothetical protein
VIDTSWTLFDGRAGEDHARVWLARTGSGVTLQTHEWGSGVEHAFGWEAIETWLQIGATALSVLAYALVADDPELDSYRLADRAPGCGLPWRLRRQRPRSPTTGRARSGIRVDHAVTMEPIEWSVAVRRQQAP